jgi:hypothetical protein
MVNVALLNAEYGISREGLTNLFHFVRANKSNRFGSQWYDFLEKCSSQSGREYMDLSLYLVQLESMLYFLLNGGEKSTKGCCVDKFINDFSKSLGFMSDEPNDYMKGGEPINVCEESSLPKVLIGVKMAKEASIRKRNVANFSMENFFVSCEGKLQSKNMKDSLNALKTNGFYEVCNREDKGKENFAILIDVLKFLFWIRENEICTSLLNASRNNAVHNGGLNLTYHEKREIVKSILLLAVKISPKAESPNYSFLVPHFFMEKIGALFSGFSLRKISDWVRQLKEFVLFACERIFISLFFLVLLVVFGYFLYKDDTVYINFDNVPEVKRIELYDRIITGNATEEYVQRLQKEVKSSNKKIKE